MNKASLAAAMAQSAGVSQRAAGMALDGLIEAVTKALKKGEKVTITGFGTFMTSKRGARTGRNPRTGQTIKIAARTVARFKVGKGLADAVA